MKVFNFFTLLSLVLSLIFLKFETSFLIQNQELIGISQSLEEQARVFPFKSSESKIQNLNLVLDKAQEIKNTPFSSQKLALEGKISFVLGLEEPKAENKISNFCKARSNFLEAASYNPTNTNYHLSILDIESLSPQLIKICDTYSNQHKQSFVSLSDIERLNLIKEIAPRDPPTLYKKGLLERALGKRLMAMESFREFEENIRTSKYEYRQFFISQAKDQNELHLLIPRKIPLIFTWLREYSRSPNLNIDYKNVFETIILSLLETEYDTELSMKETDEKNKILIQSYMNPTLKNFPKIKNKLAKILFKNLSLYSNDRFGTKYFKKVSTAELIQSLSSEDFSTKSKSGSQIYNWQGFEFERRISLDLRSEGIGYYLGESKGVNLIIITGKENSVLPENLEIEIWISQNNKTYEKFQNLKAIDHGMIQQTPKIIFECSPIRSKYVKLFFNYQGNQVPSINGDINSIIQLYKKG